MMKVKITEAMLNNLEYDDSKKQEIEVQPIRTVAAMFVFSTGDLNAAAHHLSESLRNPSSMAAIASIFVEEAVLERFLAIARPQLPKYDATVTDTPSYNQAKASASRINAKVIDESTNNSSGAFLVCDIAHEHLGSSRPIGFATLHTFRTAKEAISLFGKETLKFSEVTIWNVNHSCAYELVGALPCSDFLLNCYGVSFQPLADKVPLGGNSVCMNKSHHYEAFSYEGVPKRVVFPVGTIFAN